MLTSRVYPANFPVEPLLCSDGACFSLPYAIAPRLVARHFVHEMDASLCRSLNIVLRCAFVLHVSLRFHHLGNLIPFRRWTIHACISIDGLKFSHCPSGIMATGSITIPLHAYAWRIARFPGAQRQRWVFLKLPSRWFALNSRRIGNLLLSRSIIRRRLWDRFRNGECCYIVSLAARFVDRCMWQWLP